MVFKLQLPASCILVGALAATLALSLAVFRHEIGSEQAEFDRRAQFRARAVQQGLAGAIDALQIVNQFMVTTGKVSREQFHAFAEPMRAHYPYVEAFAFYRLVQRAQRAAFEARMGLQHPGYAISDFVAGARRRAPDRQSYKVIDYIEPMTRNEAFVGLDAAPLFSDDSAYQRAEHTGLPAATALFPSLHGPQQRRFRIVMPVYVRAEATGAAELTGFTVAVLRSGDLVEKILDATGSSKNAGLDIRVYAAASADESKRVFGPPITAQPSALPTISHEFDVAGMPWRIDIAAQAAPFTAIHGNSLLALFIGLLGSAAAVAFVQSASVRTQAIQLLVAQRTEELRRVNQALVEDIAARQLAEQALVDSEEQARELAELSSDWSWEQDEHFRFTGLAAGSRDKGSLQESILLGTTRWELRVDLAASDWAEHRARHAAHLPFRNFEYKRLIDGGRAQWISSSGNPIFDAEGRFKGYRGTSRNITDRKQAEEALRRSRSMLRKLAGHLERAKEDERKRIARDIHDELGQNLLALRIDVSRMVAFPDTMTVTRQWTESALEHIDTTIAAVREIINDLRPTVLDLGLHAAVEWQAREFERRSGIACELHIDHDEFAIDEERATALFRIVQESLTNIMRHAQASTVRIALLRQGDQFSVQISDDGVGLSQDYRKKANAFGLIGIEERVSAMGGTFSADSDPGRGLEINLSIQL
jgi:PAS domain S-box-containing protein